MRDETFGIVGMRCGKLTALMELGGGWVKCECDCGGEKIALKDYLIRGKIKSCGCLRMSYPENSKEDNPLPKTSSRKELEGNDVANKVYRTWTRIRHKCNNPTSDGYSAYGGKGIKLCESWMESFDNFYRDVGDPPTMKSQLVRKDRTRNFEPDNCYWK